MEFKEIMFYVWCLGLHCMIWSLMDPTIREAVSYTFRRVRGRR